MTNQATVTITSQGLLASCSSGASMFASGTIKHDEWTNTLNDFLLRHAATEVVYKNMRFDSIPTFLEFFNAPKSADDRQAW